MINFDENETITGQLNSDSRFMNMAKFSDIIEKVVISERISHMEAVIFFCNENDLEFEEVAKFMSDVLKQKIKMNAMESGLLPKEMQLPL